MMNTRWCRLIRVGGWLAATSLLATTQAVQAQGVPAEEYGKTQIVPPTVRPQATTPRWEPQTRPSTSKNIPSEVLGKWASQLSSEHYGVRERATRQLLAAGPQALEAVAQAAAKGDLEASHRAVRILQALLDDDSRDVRASAEAALLKIASQEGNSAAGLADDALTFYQLTKQRRAIEVLRARKAAVYGDDAYDEGISVSLDKQWEGNSADLAQLKEIPSLRTLSIRGVKLDADAVATLAELRQLVELKLYGTGVSTEQHQLLARSLTETVLDRRNALLGVGSEVGIQGCLVTMVQANSAADKADIRANDQIIRFAGKEVTDFEELTSMIATRQPGEQVTIEILRDDQTLTKEVTLGEWE